MLLSNVVNMVDFVSVTEILGCSQWLMLTNAIDLHTTIQ